MVHTVQARILQAGVVPNHSARSAECEKGVSSNSGLHAAVCSNQWAHLNSPHGNCTRRSPQHAGSLFTLPTESEVTNTLNSPVIRPRCFVTLSGETKTRSLRDVVIMRSVQRVYSAAAQPDLAQ